MLSFYNRILRYLIHLLFFSLFWSGVSGRLSFFVGTAIFAGMNLGLGLFLLRSRRILIRGFIGTALLFLLFPLIRLVTALAAGLPLPWDFAGIRFYSFYLLILPFLAVSFWLQVLSEKFRRFRYAELVINGIITALLFGQDGWTMRLFFQGGVGLSFVFLVMEVPALFLLFLPGRQGPGRISSGKDFLLISALALLLLLPLSRLYRSESIKEGGGLLESSLFNFDFTPYLSLESRISLKDELVFMMQKDGPYEKLYLRRYVLGGYSQKKGFFRDPGKSYESPEVLLPDYRITETPASWEVPRFPQREWMEQTFYYINFDSSAFLGMNIPVEMTPYFPWEDSSFSRIYKVRSSVSRAEPYQLLGTELLREPPGQEDFYRYYTDFGDQKDLRELALSITEDVTGLYQKVMALEDYFVSEYLYSLNPGKAADGDQLRYFLFETRKGYCSYFAFAMTLLCRSLGIPARVALGFWLDTGGEVLNFYPVNANQAHAWVEVYFPGWGWIEFDPTSQTLAPGEQFEFASYNPEELEPYIQEILKNRGNLRIADVSLEDLPGGPAGSLRRTWEKIRRSPGRSIFFLVILLFLARGLTVFLPLLSRPRRRKRITPFYRSYRKLFLLGLARGQESLSNGELACFCRDRGAGLFLLFTRDYQTLRYRNGISDVDIKTWFDSAGDAGKELFRLLGMKQTILLLARILFIPEGRKR